MTNDTTPTGRRTRADARRNRARILEVAAESFATDGLTIPLDEIARRAGVGPGTVHRHFPTKERIFEEIILSHVEALAAEAKALRSETDAGAAFFDFCVRLIDKGMSNRGIAEALSGVGVDLQAKIAAATTDMHNAMEEVLIRAQRDDAVRGDVTIQEVKALFAGIHLAAELQPDDPQLPRRLMAIICDGLRTPHQAP